MHRDLSFFFAYNAFITRLVVFCGYATHFYHDRFYCLPLFFYAINFNCGLSGGYLLITFDLSYAISYLFGIGCLYAKKYPANFTYQCSGFHFGELEMIFFIAEAALQSCAALFIQNRCKHPVNHVPIQSTIIIRRFCPGQQFMDSIDWVCAHFDQRFGEPCLGIDFFCLAGGKEWIEDGCMMCRRIWSGEQVFFSSHRHCTISVFGEVVVNLQAGIIQEHISISILGRGNLMAVAIRLLGRTCVTFWSSTFPTPQLQEVIFVF